MGMTNWWIKKRNPLTDLLVHASVRGFLVSGRADLIWVHFKRAKVWHLSEMT